MTLDVIVCGKFPFHFSQVFCVNLNAWNVHTDVTTFAQVLVLVLGSEVTEVLVLVLVLGTQFLVLVLVLGEKS